MTLLVDVNHAADSSNSLKALYRKLAPTRAPDSVQSLPSEFDTHEPT